MEDKFKKKVEEECGGVGGTNIDEDRVMEGVGKVLEAVEGELKEGFAVLDAVHEEVDMEHVPEENSAEKGACEVAVGTSNDISQEINMGEGFAVDLDSGLLLQSVAEVAKEGKDREKLQNGMEEAVKTDVVVQGEVRKKVLDWKKVVVGGGAKRKEAVEGSQEALLAGAGSSNGAAQEGKQVPARGNGGGPRKFCRELVYDKNGGGSIDIEGVTAHVDQDAVLECEKSLERALVGRILGRLVPFGFLFRELKRKWSKYGKAHLNMVGRSSFVCFFSSMEMRDLVMKGGPWFVGKQLVGVAKWSSKFDPLSLNGFSTHI